MPELPEVETIVRSLRLDLPGREICGVIVLDPKLLPAGAGNSAEELSRAIVGRPVMEVNRRGKFLLLELGGQNPGSGWFEKPGDTSRITLMFHLRMTGRLVFVPASFLESTSRGPESRTLTSGAVVAEMSLPGNAKRNNGEMLKSTRLVIFFHDGAILRLDDVRRFATLDLHTTKLPGGVNQQKEPGKLQRLGPEPLNEDFTLPILHDRLAARCRASIKSALLDQAVIAGIGNIYADEILFQSGIRPDRRISTLTPEEESRIYKSIRNCLTSAINHGGTTVRDYVNGKGLPGDHQNYLQVYGQAGKPCLNCGTFLLKCKVGSRTSSYCPVCQQ